jgi:hypothetical protein
VLDALCVAGYDVTICGGVGCCSKDVKGNGEVMAEGFCTEQLPKGVENHVDVDMRSVREPRD